MENHYDHGEIFCFLDPSQSTDYVFLKEPIEIWTIFGRIRWVWFGCVLSWPAYEGGACCVGGMWCETMHINAMQLYQNVHSFQITSAS